MPSAANMRSVQIERSTQLQSSGRVDATCLDPAITAAASLALSSIPNFPPPPSCPASLPAGSVDRGSRAHLSRSWAGFAPQALSHCLANSAALTPKMPTRYYQDSDSCGVTTPQVSPLHAPIRPRRSASNHADGLVTALSATQRDQLLPDFAFSQTARRRSSPNRVRHPADRQFASGCFPPRIAATQLPSATRPWPAPTRTSTVLCGCACGRTGSRLCRRSFPAVSRKGSPPRTRVVHELIRIILP